MPRKTNYQKTSDTVSGKPHIEPLGAEPDDVDTERKPGCVLPPVESFVRGLSELFSERFRVED